MTKMDKELFISNLPVGVAQRCKIPFHFLFYLLKNKS